jgi:hypothetical protein
MAVYDIGDNVRIYAPFVVGTTPTDPTAITLIVRKPSGTETTYTYGEAEITRSSAGNYHKDIVPDQHGEWKYRWEGTGAAVAAFEGSFDVRKQTVGS